METQKLTDYKPNENETLEDVLFRIGQLKETGKIETTWEEIALFMKDLFAKADHSEIWFRRAYKKIKIERAAADASSEDADASERGIIKYFNELHKERLRIKDERNSIRREKREDSRRTELFELFETEIQKAKPIRREPITYTNYDKAMLICLGDLHYGLDYRSAGGIYDSNIANNRIIDYENKIEYIAKQNECSVAYVCLLGDMISGNIHTTTRIENREDIVEQIVGVSELVSDFLRHLSGVFSVVNVNSVPGNHSRVDANMDNTLRGERMDNLITWYCKAKLSDINNIIFVENKFDSTVGTFEIFGKTYASVHGDYDPDMKISAARIAAQLGKPLYCLILGHLHVATTQFEDVVYLRNGSVCGSGDEYTMKKRLFGPPIQVCAVVSHDGIESVHPVRL